MRFRLNKKNRNKIILISFVLIMVGIALLITFNLDYFEGMISSFVQKYGLVAIFIFIFILDMLFQPIGPEVPVLIGVLFGLNVFLVILFSIIASGIASFINFYVGKGYLFSKLRQSGYEDYSRHLRFFKKYGKWGVFVASIGPVPWVPFCWMAGSFKMKLRQFVFYGVIPRFLRITGVALAVKYFQGILF